MHSPISIPELDRESITWAMCRNPMCRNFAVPYSPKKTSSEGTLTSEANYRIVSRAEQQLACRYCDQRFKLGSNEAIRPIARYFHSLSLPIATCPNPDCTNYGVNVFENLAPVGTKKDIKYRRHKGGVNKHGGKKRDAAVCTICKKHVQLGESLYLSRDRETVRRCERMIEGVLLGVKKRRMIARHLMGISPADSKLPVITSKKYYTHLYRCAIRMNSYHTWMNARLFMPSCKVDFTQMARVSTDVISIPLRRGGNVHRSRNLRIIVSVLALKDTFYILAAHPFFLPLTFGPDPKEDFIDRRTGKPSREFAHQWHCLEHPVHNRFKAKTPEDMLKNLADVSQFNVGCYIRSPYAEAAHFLVVEKMLRRFQRVCFYMDAAKEQRAAAMVALAPGILSRRIEVVMVQREHHSDKESDGDAADAFVKRPREGSDARKALLRKAWAETEERVQNVFGDREIKPTRRDPHPSDDRKAADAYKTAFLTAIKRKGKWAWLDYPPPIGDERLSRSLWVTRMPDKTFDDAEDPLFHASLQRVESSMNAMRDRLPAMSRAGVRAKPKRSYRGSYKRALPVSYGLFIYLLARNFTQLSEDQKLIPAIVLGLLSGRRAFPYHIDTVFDFQLGLEHAETLTRWLRK